MQGAHATTVFAAQLLTLTMVRKGELIRSRWAEFDLDGAQWTIPAERMKMKRPHRVFLSTQAVELLRMPEKMTGAEGPTGYVFPTIFRRSTPMADVTLNHFFKRLDFGVPEFSPHGTRSTAATLLREHGFDKDVVELLLAHQESDQTVAAYSHMELVPERKRAMPFLADRIERLAAGADACTDPGGPPASAPADLLARAADHARQLADYADAARIAGTACERSYDALMESAP